MADLIEADLIEELLKKYEAAMGLISEILKEFVKLDPTKATEYLNKAQKILKTK